MVGDSILVDSQKLLNLKRWSIYDPLLNRVLWRPADCKLYRYINASPGVSLMRALWRLTKLEDAAGIRLSSTTRFLGLPTFDWPSTEYDG
jgi:hypothetical protein